MEQEALGRTRDRKSWYIIKTGITGGDGRMERAVPRWFWRGIQPERNPDSGGDVVCAFCSSIWNFKIQTEQELKGEVDKTHKMQLGSLQ